MAIAGAGGVKPTVRPRSLSTRNHSHYYFLWASVDSPGKEFVIFFYFVFSKNLSKNYSSTHAFRTHDSPGRSFYFDHQRTSKVSRRVLLGGVEKAGAK